ncbi:hypothetical protein TNCV_1239061 [Trichonephila clavipes]|nr:hypothetical protein TNCV_1239061 [Trichonephila clavipes]
MKANNELKRKRRANALENELKNKLEIPLMYSGAAGDYNFAFRVTRITLACSKMDITPMKRSKIIALDEHTSMTMRDIATAVVVGKSSVFRILRTFQDSGTSSPKRKGNLVASGKLLHELIKSY